jgi:hypothetical protein
MAAVVTATTNGGEKDWREECVKPQKDDRVQTLVGRDAVIVLNKLGYFKLRIIFLLTSFLLQ